jgi:hypothetical protein
MAQKTVIIVTPYLEFGELVSHCLQKNLAWKVGAAYASDSLAGLLSTYKSLDYALLDMEIGLEHIRESVFYIRDKFPYTEITLISKEEPPEEAEDFRPWKLLTKPFIESDLLEIFKYANVSESKIVIDGVFSDEFDMSLPTWARDRVAMRKIMINSIASMDAQEALLFSKNKVLAQTDKNQVIDFDSCSRIVYKYLDPNETGEIIKPINLNSTTYLLHATILAVGIILAILYKPETPYQDIRHQTKYLESSLTGPKLSSKSLNSLPDSVRMDSECKIFEHGPRESF